MYVSAAELAVLAVGGILTGAVTCVMSQRNGAYIALNQANIEERLGPFVTIIILTLVDIVLGDQVSGIWNSLGYYYLRTKTIKKLFSGEYQNAFVTRAVNDGMLDALDTRHRLMATICSFLIRLGILVWNVESVRASIVYAIISAGLIYGNMRLSRYQTKINKAQRSRIDLARDSLKHNSTGEHTGEYMLALNSAMFKDRLNNIVFSLISGISFLTICMLNLYILWHFGVSGVDKIGQKAATIDTLSCILSWRMRDLAHCFNRMAESKGMHFYYEMDANKVKGVRQTLEAPVIEKVTIKGLKYTVTDSSRSFTLSGENVTLNRGITLLTDESGSGKSTFANLFCDLAEHGGISQFDCEVTYSEGSSTTLTQCDSTRTFGHYCCSFPAERPNFPEGNVLLRELLGVRTGGGRMARLKLRSLGLGHLSLNGQINPRYLSTGEQARICIARRLLSGHIDTARFVIFDEPDDALDANSVRHVLDTLKVYAEHKIVILISHNKHTQDILASVPHLGMTATIESEAGISVKKSKVALC